MPTYQAPIHDVLFLLKDVFNYESQVSSLPGYEDATLDVVGAVLESAAEFSQDVLLPINLPGDLEGCRLEHGTVKTPAGYKRAYEIYRQGGWPALTADPAFGGQGLPASLALIVREFVASGSMSFGMYGGLTQGAYRAILAHADDTLKRVYLPRLTDGSWAGTMCMTEPQSGSDLSTLQTRAVPAGDGSYRVTGTKIFISSGEHDLTDNIVHLVLARLPDAPPGTRGISLFIVPKRTPVIDNGVVTDTLPNNVSCGSIEHKMGIRASSTAVLNFDDARGWLIGEPHGGMRAMFTMMNSSRVGVAVQSVGVAEIAYQNALAYAQERRQGRGPQAVKGDANKGSEPIIVHPDVRKNLLTMKALVEGARALYIESAIALDVKARHPDHGTSLHADGMLALLTPVLKSFVSECALQVTDLGIQIFGGHGYIHDNGMEHFYRDARIVPLYEGTNAIQALDLVHRKLTINDGQPIAMFFDDAATLIERHRSDRSTGEMAVALNAAVQFLRRATDTVLEHVAQDPTEAAAAASDYLRLFGLVALGVVWLRMAAAASAPALDGAKKSGAFYSGKVKTANFYFTRLLPEAQLRYAAICAGAGPTMSLSSEEF